MGTFRKRVKTKGKRWIKGQSSNSNPTCKTFRSSASNDFFKEDLFGAKSGNALTVDSLKRHNNTIAPLPVSNKSEGSRISDFEIGDAETCTSFNGSIKTFNTFASDWSCCTNVTFNKLLHRFDLTSAHHKEMLAILGAVTEVIKANGGTESTVEYFGALVTTLDSINEDEGKDDSVGATLSLLSMCIKSVKREILQLKFSTISKTLMNYFKHYANSDNNVIMKSLLICLSVLLRAQDASVWHDSSTLAIYDAILAFIVHTKSKIRKAGQHAVCSILKGSDFIKEKDGYFMHPASGHTAKYCIKIMESGISEGGMTTVLHILVLLKEIIAIFPKMQLKICCETILKLMTLKNTLVTSCGLQTLHGLFISRPNIASCPATLNAQLITALYDYQPPATDVQPMLAWSAVMKEAFVNLGANDLGLCVINVPRLFQTYTSAFLCEKIEVINNVTLSMQAILKDCIALAASKTSIEEHVSSIKKVFEILSSCLKYQYHAAWKQILYLLSTMYKVCGETCQEFMMDCLKTLASLRDSDDFPYENEVDEVFGSAIESIGPQIIIQEIPIQVIEEENHKYEIKRSWLLPLLRKHIKNSTLKCFVDNFLPMATFLRKKHEALSKTNDKVGAVTYDLLQSQIWALLPSFCSDATDLKETFPTIAKHLGYLLSTKSDLRPTVLAALRKLVHNCKTNDKDVDVMARFAKNYLPILFNMYTIECKKTDEEAARISAFDTIKVYLTVAEDSLVQDLFNKALQKLESEETEKSNFLKESILDLIRILLPYQYPESLKLLFDRHIKKVEKPKDFKEEKKFYRLLEDLCSCQSERCNDFINNNLSIVKDLLVNTVSSTSLPSRGPRIRTIKALLLYDSSPKTIFAFLPEAVLCCKDGNKRCRLNAFELVVAMANTMAEKQGESGVGKYLDKLSAGLVGSTSMIAATISALSSAIYCCRAKLIKEQFDAILKNICLLSQSKTREIVGPALGFLKVAILPNDISYIPEHLPLIVKTLSSITDDCKRKFRQKIRDLYDRLIRKFGADTIIAFVPTHDGVTLTRLKALRKIQNRKLKQKQERKEMKTKKESHETSEIMFSTKRRPKTINEILAECDDDDEMNESLSEDDTKLFNKKKSKQNVYIKEDEDSIIDFTSPSASKNITSLQPDNNNDTLDVKSKKKKKTEFPTAPDGRLLIMEEKVEKLPPKNEFDSEEESIASDAEAEENLSKMMTNIGISRKRKASIGDVDEPCPKYQAGGKGIHRKVDKNIVANVQTGEDFKSKKAKGDVKKKGKPDPYAYIPLSRNALNRRKKKKSAGQFKHIVQSAKKGALQGSKNKFKNKKRQRK